jgi:predicted phosphodiesterase
LRVEPAQIELWIKELQGEGYNIRQSGKSVELTTELPIGTKLTIDPQTLYNGSFYRFGIVSDTHLGSKYAREDVLKLAYDVFEREGITTVYHSGNIVDGYAKKINHFDLLPGLTGFSAQIDYLIKNYPHKEGITTNFITSACHEGWWISDIGINIGELIQLKAQGIGREDLKWIGHQEVDIELKQPKGSAVIRITHPGGGSSYAISYSTQKLVESFSGGEKPAILICGHFHKALLHYVRNVWVIQSASTQDQSPWMRRHRLSSELGFWIIEFHQAKTGEINRFRGEFFPSFDRGYYKKYVSW